MASYAWYQIYRLRGGGQKKKGGQLGPEVPYKDFKPKGAEGVSTTQGRTADEKA